LKTLNEKKAKRTFAIYKSLMSSQKHWHINKAKSYQYSWHKKNNQQWN